MKKAAIYARVSSDAQRKEGTIKSQVAELRRQVKVAGDIIAKEYIDDGHSGASLDRPALNDLRQDLRSGDFDVVYVLHVDRLSRDLTNLKIVVSDIFMYKKRLVINGRDCMDDPEHKFEMTILGAVAEFEREKILERSMRGRMHRLRHGQLMSNGQRIFGYTYVRKTDASTAQLEINECEAKIVREIFVMYAKGNVSCGDIAEHLKKKGLVKERVALSADRIRYMLGNEAYAGTRFYNTMGTRKIDQGPGKKKKRIAVSKDRSEWIGIPVPAIVSKELFEQARERLTYNRTCFRNGRGTQPLSNLVFCPLCKKRCHTFRKFYAVKRLQRTVYYDRRYFKCHACSENPQIDVRILESQIRELIQEDLFNPAKLKARIDIFQKKANGIRRMKTESEQSLRKIQVLSSQRRRIVDLYTNNGIEQTEYARRTKEYEAKIRQLEATRKQLLLQLPLLTKPELIDREVKEYSARIKECFEEAVSTGTWRQFFLEFVDSVEYNKRAAKSVRFSLHGSIPVRCEEEVLIGFTVNKTVSSVVLDTMLRELNRPDAPTEDARVEVPRATYMRVAQTV